MEQEFISDGVRYIAAKHAAEKTAYTQDYVSRLCREGKVIGQRVGKNWFVSIESLDSFVASEQVAAEDRRKGLIDDAREHKILQEGSVVLDGMKYISAKHAASLTGYASDYISRRVGSAEENQRCADCEELVR